MEELKEDKSFEIETSEEGGNSTIDLLGDCRSVYG